MTGATHRALTRVAVPAIPAPLIVFAGALVVLILRRPEGILRAQWWADDGPMYQWALERGLHTLVESYGGVLLPAQRLAVLASTLVPPPYAPLVGSIIALVALAAVAAFVASDRLAGFVPDPARRAGIAVALVLVPISSDVIGSLSHFQWVMGAFLVAYAGASPGSRWELVPLAAAALSGPQAVFILPLYALRWIRDRWTWPRLVVVAACAGLELAVLAGYSRPYAPPAAADAAASFVAHMTTMPVALGVAVLAIAALAAWRAPRWTLALVPLILAIPVSGMFRMSYAYPDWWDGTRYFWLSAWLLAAIVIAASSSPARTAFLAIAAMIALSRFVLYVPPDMDWSVASRCIGGPAPCVVPVAPSETWWVRWP